MSPEKHPGRLTMCNLSSFQLGRLFPPELTGIPALQHGFHTILTEINLKDGRFTTQMTMYHTSQRIQYFGQAITQIRLLNGLSILTLSLIKLADLHIKRSLTILSIRTRRILFHLVTVLCGHLQKTLKTCSHNQQSGHPRMHQPKSKSPLLTAAQKSKHLIMNSLYQPLAIKARQLGQVLIYNRMPLFTTVSPTTADPPTMNGPLQKK